MEPTNLVKEFDVGSHLVEVQPQGAFTGAVTLRLRYRTGAESSQMEESRLYTFSLEGTRLLAKALAEAAEEASKMKWTGPTH